MRYDEIRELLRNYFANALAQHKEAVLGEGRLSPFMKQIFDASKRRAEQPRTGPQADEQSALDALVVETILQRGGVVEELSTKEKSQILAEYRSADSSYVAEVIAFDASFDRYDLSTTEASAARPSYRTKAAAMRQSVTVSELARQFSEYNGKQDVWTAATTAERLRQFELLNELLGADTSASDVSVEDAIHVRDMLLGMPSNRNKKRATKDLAVDEQVGVSDAPRMQQRTVKKYLQTFHGMFAWAALEKRVSSNPFDGINIMLNAKKLDAEARDAFTQQQLVSMLAVLDSEAGPSLRSHQRWGTLIGMYTGARLNEICQLEVSDIRDIDGILCFDMNDEGEAKSLKTGAARRIVPVHSELLGRGLQAFVQSVRDAKHVRLFHELNYDPKNKWGRALSRWFNERFLVELELKSKKLTYHSLRHAMVTELFRADVEETMIKSIVGHKRGGVTAGTYFKGYTTAQKRDALEKFMPQVAAADTDASRVRPS